MFRVEQPVLIFQRHLSTQIFMVSWSLEQKTKASIDAEDELKWKEEGNPSLAATVYPAGLTFNSILTWQPPRPWAGVCYVHIKRSSSSNIERNQIKMKFRKLIFCLIVTCSLCNRTVTFPRLHEGSGKFSRKE